MSTPGASSEGLFEDPLEEISKLSKSRSTKAGVSSESGDVFGDIDSLIGQRDLQNLKEQEERQRVSVTLDVEIKRWVAGKEGNLRSMLSSLQYILWPECGWQFISLTDLIPGASVKEAYRKALCVSILIKCNRKELLFSRNM